jgi:DNA mismatch repair ATPase MutS
MSLLTDQQTRNDLELSVGNTRNSKVFALFNRTRTAGGAGLLEEFFAYPLTGRTAIAKRIARCRYFQETGRGFHSMPARPNWWNSTFRMLTAGLCYPAPGPA